MGEIDNMLLALCFQRIANAAKSYLVVQSQVAGNYHFRIPDAKITSFTSACERQKSVRFLMHNFDAHRDGQRSMPYAAIRRTVV